MPRTESDATDEGFVKFSDCLDNNELRGNRYMDDGDVFLILIYDVNGYIAGIQAGFPKSFSSTYPPDTLKPPFIDDGDKWVVTIYFVDPSIICTTGRTQQEFNSDGTGTNLYIQTGTNPETDYMIIPRDEKDLDGTLWNKGGCFPVMGVHYWYNNSREIPCDEFLPVFPMYNGGKLNAFGWVFFAKPDFSKWAEFPPTQIELLLKVFLKQVPRCAKGSDLSSLHMYLTKDPFKDMCVA
ncbi:hypothetical protein ScPMuIL_001686 [Solemya velum]